MLFIKSWWFFYGLAFLLVWTSCQRETAQVEAPLVGVRGVWLTNIASEVLNSREQINSAVELCHDLGFNTIFVVTWNRATTTYPSQVVEAVTGVSIQPEFEGRDPLQELIEAAKPYGIKIFAWFEFGFSSSYQEDDGGPLIRANPHWASLDIKGKITEKNGFQWMNPFHPEVQQFMTEMILEVVAHYDIDGIQGDDRLPALPSNGGYDHYTKALYAEDHSGKMPPDNEKDYDWVKWRSAKLNAYLAELYGKVKAVNPEIIISMAPSIYPWSEAEYLQDWPSWVNMGVVDLMVPQIYRYDLKAYQKEFDKIINDQIGSKNLNLFYPGVILQVDDYNPDAEILKGIINTHREHGINGEVFFFYEGIKKYKEEFKEWYGNAALEFPNLK